MPYHIRNAKMINYLKTLVKSRFFNINRTAANNATEVPATVLPEDLAAVSVKPETFIYVDLDNVLSGLPAEQQSFCVANLHCFLFKIAASYPGSSMQVFGNLGNWGWQQQTWHFKGHTIELIDTPLVTNHGKTLADPLISEALKERSNLSEKVVLVSADVDFSIPLRSLKRKGFYTELILFSHCCFLLREAAGKVIHGRKQYPLDELVKCHNYLTNYLSKLPDNEVPLPSLAHHFAKLKPVGEKRWFGHKTFADFISLFNTGWIVNNNRYQRIG